MTARQAHATHIEALDSLRAVCAICVILFHFETISILTNLPFFRHSWMLVDFFFVLSGFVITAAYADNLRNGFPAIHYIVLRLARVWPLHIVLLAGFVALELSKLAMHGPISQTLFAPPREVGSLLMNIALLQVFGIYDHLTWNVPSWSIAAEFWVYIIAAGIFIHARRATVLVLAILALCCLLLMVGWGRPYLNLAHDSSVVRCLYGFCLGSLTFSALRGHGVDASNRATWTAAEVGFVVVAIAAVSLAQGPATFAVPPLFAAGVFIFAHQGGLVSKALNWRFPVWLGSISYSIYMTHTFIIGRVLDVTVILDSLLQGGLGGKVVVNAMGARVLTGSEGFVTAILLITLCLIVAISFATYRWIEQPCNKWVRQRLGRARALPAAAAADRSTTHHEPMAQLEGAS